MLSATTQESETGFEARMKKQVSWKGVFVREYNCTKGDHPLCSDNLPVSLDWSYNQDVKVKNIECSRERNSSYSFPRRLSYEDKKKRVYGDDDSTSSTTSSDSASSSDSWSWAKPASLKGTQVSQELHEHQLERDASRQVIYCRHAHNPPHDEGEDSWRRFFGL